MDWAYSPYMLISLCVAVMSLGVGGMAWRRRSEAGAIAFVCLMGAISWWSLFYALELASPRLAWMITFAQLEYVGIVAVPVCWFLFVLLYTTSIGSIPRKWGLVLWIIPAITVGLVFTNVTPTFAGHTLIWRDVRLVKYAALAVLDISYGGWFWVHTVYSYALLLSSAVWMVVFLWRSRAVYRGQAVILLLGVLLPWVGNLIYLVNLAPGLQLDLTPFFFAFSGWLIAWGAFRFHLLEITPVARWAMVDSMGDAMLALDLQGRIVDLNPVAQTLFENPSAEVIGKTLVQVFPAHRALVEYYLTLSEARDEVQLALRGVLRDYDLRVSSLHDRRRRLRGKLIVLRDITERKHLESSLEYQLERFEQLLAVARATTEQPTLSATLDNTLEIAMSLTGAEIGSIFLVDEHTIITQNLLTGARTSKVAARELVEQLVRDGLAGWVIRAERTAMIQDIAVDDRWLTLPNQAYQAGSALGIPIFQSERTVGALVLVHSQPRHFTSRDADVMEAAVQQMALAIRNAKIYEAQRRMADQQVTLYEVMRTLQRVYRPEQVVQVAVDRIARLTDWPLVALLKLNHAGQEFILEGSAGSLQFTSDESLPLALDIIGQVVQNPHVHYVPDIHATVSHPLPALPDVRSFVLTPLLEERKVQRILLVASDESDAFDVDARLLAESLAEVISLVMRNAHLYTVLQNELIERQRMEDRLWRTLNKTDALYRVSRALIGGYDLSAALQTVVNGVADALGADKVLLATLDLEKRQLTALLKGGPQASTCALKTYEDVVQGVPGWVIRTGDPVLYPGEVDACDPEVSSMCAEMSLSSAVMAPLSIMGARVPYGVLGAMITEPQREFSQQDLGLITAIAAQVAIAIHNVQLFHRVSEQQSRLQALVRSSRDGVVLIGMDLRIFVINQTALTYLQLTGEPGDWVNQPLWPALTQLRTQTPHVARVLIREMRRVQRGTETPIEGEYQIGTRIVYWSNLPVMGEGDIPLGRLVVLRDITESRTVEKMREDLTHTMVHDLRNPLTGIGGSLQLLSTVASNLPAAYRELLEVARSSTDRMLGLVNAILDISRLESGRMPLNPTVFDLHDVVNEVLMLQYPLAEQRGIMPVDALPEVLPLVWGDIGLISRVLQNLIGNALKFTPAGGKIEVKAWLPDPAQDGQRLYVAVSDTGVGIPPELQERLFQKFVTGQEEGRGSGLGLAFCKMVLEAHGERIWVSSILGEGTTFTFTLPPAIQSMM
ncbi:MAG: GAF domain-containing protein [Anaerolineae bacterium]|nr:GAF domain-containing protein [Anaerolineae bacterium]